MRWRCATVLLLVAFAAMPQVSWAERAVVLVTHKDNLIEEISTLEIRKAYLGISVTIDGQTVRAYRLANDDELNQIFMQSVMAMSERSYERRLLSFVLKFGRPRPIEVGSPSELSDSIDANRNSIGYMWKQDAEADSRLQIIKVLWQEF
jgi:hypothetical protein